MTAKDPTLSHVLHTDPQHYAKGSASLPSYMQKGNKGRFRYNFTSFCCSIGAANALCCYMHGTWRKWLTHALLRYIV